jgi:hypothetical protein
LLHVVGADSLTNCRAYVVHAHPERLKTDGDKIAFTKSVATWIASRVAKHKLLRGGVVLINAVPKRYVKAEFGRVDCAVDNLISGNIAQQGRY